MSDDLALHVEEFTLHRGTVAARDDGAAAAPPGSLRRGRQLKGTAYVLADADGIGADEARLRIRHQIHTAYYQDSSRSLTSSLLRAVQSAHRELRAENERTVRSQRCFGRVACAVVRDQDVYLALAGGTAAYVYSEGTVSLINGGHDGQVGAEMLGGHAEPETELLHRRLEPGEAILLTNGDVPDLNMIPGESLGAIIRKCQRTYRGPARRILVLSSGQIVTSPHDDITALRGAVEEEARIAAAAGTLAMSMPRAFGAVAPTRVQTFDDDDDAYSDVQIGDRLVSFLEETGTSLNRASHRASRLLTLGVAALLLVVVASVCAYVPYRIWQDRSLGSDVSDLVAQAEQRERQALALTDPNEQRLLLIEASDFASRAARVRKDDTAVQSLQARLAAQLDELNSVVRPTRFTRLAEVSDTVTGFAQTDDALILADNAGARVQSFTLTNDGSGLQEEQPTPIIRAGDLLHGESIAPIKAAIWVPAGSTRLESGLLLLTEAGQLIEYQPGKGLTALRTEAVRNATLVAGYAGSLYVLSVADGTLKWYMPTSNGYDGPAYDYFAPGIQVDLSDVKAMAVGGDVYLLRNDGRIDRFTAGKPQPFNDTMPDVPLRNPTALALTNDGLFVADSGNRRIVEFDRDGNFRRQYRGGPDDQWPANIQALAADPARQRLFIVNPDGVYSVDISAERPAQ